MLQGICEGTALQIREMGVICVPAVLADFILLENVSLENDYTMLQKV